MSDTDALMTPEVASALGVTRQTLHRWDASGRLRPYLRGSHRSPHLYRRSEVEALRAELDGALRLGRPSRLTKGDTAKELVRHAFAMLVPEFDRDRLEKFLAHVQIPG